MICLLSKSKFIEMTIRLAASCFGGLGLGWTVLECYTHFFGKPDISPATFVLVFLLLGLLWFLIDGFAINKYLSNSIRLTKLLPNTDVVVKFGDIFCEEGFKAISVNEYFDCAVNNKHVSENTLHGQMLMRYWKHDEKSWYETILSDLKNIEHDDSIYREEPGKSKRFPIGTTAYTRSGENHFLCFVISNTDIISNTASSNSDFLQHAIRGLLRKAREECSGRPLNIPLIGNGLSRAGVRSNIIVDLILLAIVEESNQSKITNEIKIVLHKSLCDKISLSSIYEDWK